LIEFVPIGVGMIVF